MNISYSPQAVADLDSIHAHISEYSAAKADEYVARILQAIRMLEAFFAHRPPWPRRDHAGACVVGNALYHHYITIYRIRSETDLDILTIKHGRQQYP